jgi:hypothetical protein
LGSPSHLNFVALSITLGSYVSFFGFGFFSSLFLQEVLNEDVHHVDAFLKLEDV